MIDWSKGLPFMIGPFEVGLTETSPETAGYWAGVADGQLRIKHCAGCGRFLHPRRIFCPECRSNDLPWFTSSGSGVVYSFSTIHHPPSPEFVGPYTNGIIELSEGVFLFGRIVEAAGREVAIGDPVRVAFRTVVVGGDVLPVFEVT